MTNKKFKRGFEFSLDGQYIYKITDLLQGNHFLAIFIGDYERRDIVTYNAYTKHGHFRLDNALFELVDGKINRVHNATGFLGLEDSTEEYKKAVKAI